MRNESPIIGRTKKNVKDVMKKWTIALWRTGFDIYILEFAGHIVSPGIRAEFYLLKNFLVGEVLIVLLIAFGARLISNR
jgi:hypothetical protein